MTYNVFGGKSNLAQSILKRPNKTDLSDKNSNYLSTSRFVSFLVTLQQLRQTKVGDFDLSWTMHYNSRQFNTLYTGIQPVTQSVSK